MRTVEEIAREVFKSLAKASLSEKNPIDVISKALQKERDRTEKAEAKIKELEKWNDFDAEGYQKKVKELEAEVKACKSLIRSNDEGKQWQEYEDIKAKLDKAKEALREIESLPEDDSFGYENRMRFLANKALKALEEA